MNASSIYYRVKQHNFRKYTISRQTHFNSRTPTTRSIRKPITDKYSFHNRSPSRLFLRYKPKNVERNRESVNNSVQTCSSRSGRYRAETTHEITRNIAGHLVNTGNIYQTFLLSARIEKLGQTSGGATVGEWNETKRANERGRANEKGAAGHEEGRLQGVVPKLLTA